MTAAKLAGFSAAALVAFAANSLLCRVALLQEGTIDPVSFTTVRLLSGAVTLLLIVAFRGGVSARGGSWGAAASLFAYAIFFSVAYVKLTAATGALLLFGAVQVTMIGSSVVKGERLATHQWIGLVLAFSGLVILCAPGVERPDLLSAGSMVAAGLAWGIYSLKGRGSQDPIVDTASNFMRSVPLALVATSLSVTHATITTRGLVFAVISGAVASGLGYSIWYAVVPFLGATRASVLQLAVPLIAAAGGMMLLAEDFSTRFVIAAVATIGGIALSSIRTAKGQAT